MNRRDFLQRAVPVGALPFLVGGLPVSVYGRSPFLEALVASATPTDRVLVLVQLNGGNDGLNTVIPLDQYSALAQARSNILIDEAQVLRLTDATGLHPAMTGLQALFGISGRQTSGSAGQISIRPFPRVFSGDGSMRSIPAFRQDIRTR
jgi:uncharacterized protein (DUF1501 family)